MAKTRKPIPYKKKALLQKEIASKCPICRTGEVDHFQIHHIDEDSENDDFDNLLMLCPLCHSKITKGDISQSDVVLIKQKLKMEVQRINPTMGKVINFHSKVKNAVIGDNNKVTIHTGKAIAAGRRYADGSIGADHLKNIYISYLVSRYHEYKLAEVGKGNMNYAIFPSSLKKKFKIGKTRTIYDIPVNRFEELAGYIQSRINGTWLAKNNKYKNQPKNYQSFEEYAAIQSQ